jgi:hypothetical protein
LTGAAPYVVRLSPSRVEKFFLCQARWGYSELPGGVAEPGSDATDFGTEVHACHEHRYRDGKPYDTTTRAGWCAQAMAPHLPRALPPYGAPELELTYDAGDVTLVGRLDLTWPYHDRAHGGKLVACVTDYKTTGGMRYAKLERDALFGHSQAPLYALMAMRHYGTDTAFCHWVYATRPPLVMPAVGWPASSVVPSDHYIGRAEAEERVMLRLVPAAREMKRIADAGLTAADAGTLPKNLRSCRAFNKLCPYYQTCKPRKDQDMSEANAFLAGLGMSSVATTPPATQPAAPSAADAVTPTAPATPTTGTTRTTPAAPPSQDGKPDINPPEAADGKGKGKGKGKSNDGPKFTAEELDALADVLIDRIALRLMRNVK